MRRCAWLGGGIVVVVSVLLELLSRHHAHAVFWWHAVPAFDLFYGVAGAVGLVVVAEWLAHTWLDRPEDYYDGDRTA
jgi:hypothetical protein